MHRLLRFGSRFAAFAASTLLLTILTLISMPVMIQASGLKTWGFIALGQGAGAFFMVVVGWGWWIGGAVRVAELPTASRPHEYATSFAARLPLLVILTPVMVGLGFLIGRAEPWAVVSGLLFSASMGLTANWYFSGAKQPLALFLTETAPRALGTITAIIMMLNGHSAVTGVLIQTASMLLAAVCSTAWILRRVGRPELAASIRKVPSALAERKGGLTAGLLNACYQALPILIVSAAAHPALGQFAVFDKLIRQFTVGLNPVVAAVQGSIPSYMSNRRRAHRVHVHLVLVVVVASGVLAILAPIIIGYLSDWEVRPDLIASILFASCVGLTFTNTMLAKGFLPLFDDGKLTARLALIGVATALPLIGILCVAWGSNGALVGLAAGAGVQAVMGLLTLRRFTR